MRALIAVCGAAVARQLAGCSSGASGADTAPGMLHGPYPVVRAVDGDTIRVNRNGEEIVIRFIGLDTPETVAPDRPVECFGPEASARTTELVEGGQVWLEYDEASGLTDKYDRTLAFVWLDPQTMLNELLIAEGYAEEVTYTDGYAHQRDFQDAERAAQSARVGLWSAC
ncbi:MAG: thermonuclease family protein [Candidatus Nanopelagicales bacterium]